MHKNGKKYFFVRSGVIEPDGLKWHERTFYWSDRSIEYDPRGVWGLGLKPQLVLSPAEINNRDHGMPLRCLVRWG